MTSLVGILNGTANYILSEMTTNGLDFDTALSQAQELGFAEADPTLDIEGFDAAHKLCLLIRLAFGRDYPFSMLPVQGISGVDRMDIEFAREFGYRLKLLGEVRNVDGRLEAGVFPMLVHHTYLIARVGGAYNAVRMEGNAVGPVFLHGLGAGATPTGSAVLSDIMAVARGCAPNNTGFVEQVPAPADIMPPEEAEACYYFRVMVRDQPGVLRDLAGAMARQDISIAQAVQKGQDPGGVPIVFMTHEAKARNVAAALEDLKGAGLLLAEPVHYRIL
jgi:homoserine dehydrogenase